MQNDQRYEILSEIFYLLANDYEYPLNVTLLYARVDTGFVAPSIFKEVGEEILYQWPDLGRLADALLDLWDVEEEGKRWAEIEYVVRGGKFDAIFIHPAEIDLEEDPFVRRDRVVRRHLGENPIVYPPPPAEDDDAITF